MKPLSYRLISQADHPQLLQFWKECEGICLSDSDTEPKFALYLRRNPKSNFLALSGEQIAGTALAGHDGRRGILRHVAVDPQFRKRGIARELIERCLKAIADEGIERSYAIVLENNAEGLEFWNRIGWEDLEECKLFASGKVSCS